MQIDEKQAVDIAELQEGEFELRDIDQEVLDLDSNQMDTISNENPSTKNKNLSLEANTKSRQGFKKQNFSSIDSQVFASSEGNNSNSTLKSPLKAFQKLNKD